MQLAPVTAGGQLPVGLVGLPQRVVCGDGDVAEEVWREPFDAGEVDLGQATARDLAGADPVGLLADRGVGDVGLVARQRGGLAGGHFDPILLRGIGHPGQARVEGDGRLEAQFAGNVAELEYPGDLTADGLEELFVFGGCVGDAVQLFGLGERGGGDVGDGLRCGLGRRCLRIGRRPVASLRLAGEGSRRQGGRAGEEVSTGGVRRTHPTAARRVWSAG